MLDLGLEIGEAQVVQDLNSKQVQLYGKQE